MQPWLMLAQLIPPWEQRLHTDLAPADELDAFLGALLFSGLLFVLLSPMIRGKIRYANKQARDLEQLALRFSHRHPPAAEPSRRPHIGPTAL